MTNCHCILTTTITRGKGRLTVLRCLDVKDQVLWRLYGTRARSYVPHMRRVGVTVIEERRRG